jgi:hypothetical protein
MHEHALVCARACMCVTDEFHHRKEENNNMSTTKTRKEMRERGQQAKLAIPNVQKNMSTNLMRERERKTCCIALGRGGEKAGSYYCRRCGKADLL